jgi:ABC-type sugar transport system substrate-binding protein
MAEIHTPDGSLTSAGATYSRATVLRWLAVGAVTAPMLAACTRDGGSAQAVATTAASGSSGVTAAIGDSYKGKTIGVVFYTLLDENEVSIGRWLEQAAKDAGLEWTFVTVDAKGDQAQAQTAMSSFITRKVDAIIVVVVPAIWINAQLEQAKAAGIPVVGNLMFAQFEPNIAVDYGPLLDHDTLLLTHYLMSDQQARRGTDRIKVGMLDASVSEALVPGRSVFETLLGLDDQFEIVAKDFAVSGTDTVADATKRAKGMVQANPDINAIFCNYPPIAVPAASGIEQLGNTDVQVYGRIAQSAGVEAVRSGSSPLVATSWVDWPYQSYTIIEQVLIVLKGEEPNRLLSLTRPVPDVVFDASNVDEQVPTGTKAADWMFAGGAYRSQFIARWNEVFA